MRGKRGLAFRQRGAFANVAANRFAEFPKHSTIEQVDLNVVSVIAEHIYSISFYINYKIYTATIECVPLRIGCENSFGERVFL